MGVRRQRIKLGQPEILWDGLGRLPFEIETGLSPATTRTILALAEKHRLTAYDAAYLELAARRRMPLATLDVELRRGAIAELVALL